MIRRILIVDSEIRFTVSIKRALEETGNYEARTVTRLSPAVNALQEDTYDLAVIAIELDQADPVEVAQAMRQIQPDLPVILTGFQEDYQALLEAAQAQTYLAKRYTARELIPVIEETVAAGYSTYTAQTQPGASFQPDEASDENVIDPLIAMSRTKPHLQEPPVSAYDSTIREVIDTALDPEVSRRIQEQVTEDEPMPDEPTDQLNRSDESDDWEESPVEFPASAALSVTNDPVVLDDLLQEIHHSLSQMLGVKPPSERQAQASAAEPVPSSPRDAPEEPEPPSERQVQLPGPGLDPIPTDEDTRYDFIPRPRLLPESSWLDQIVATPPEPIAEASPPPATVPEIAAEEPVQISDEIEEEFPDPDEELEPATLEQVTERLMAIAEDEEDENEDEEPTETIPLTNQALGHYALQLTQFSLESSAQATLLTQGGRVLGKAGELDEKTWSVVIEVIRDAWSRPGDARTRVIYRHLSAGEMLIYSVQTIDDQTLSLLFSAETSLRVIRRQSVRLVEALKSIPPPSPPELNAIPIAPEFQPEVEPTSAGESREPLVTPERVDEVETSGPAQAAETVLEKMGPEIAPAESATSESPPVKVPHQPAQALSDYACFWMLEDEAEPMSSSLLALMDDWLNDFCDAQGWKFQSCDLNPDWLVVRLEVPSATLPNDIVFTLMENIESLIVPIEPQRAGKPLWSDGYLITAPAEDLTPDAIERFINFYRHERLTN